MELVAALLLRSNPATSHGLPLDWTYAKRTTNWFSGAACLVSRQAKEKRIAVEAN